MKASLRFLFIVLLLSVCLATKIKTKAKGKSKNKRRSAVEKSSEDPAPAPANAEPPAPIKLDTTGLFIPSNPPNLSKKPQIVIQRQGKANPSEAYHEQLQANEQSPVPILTVKPAFAVLNTYSISFFDGENVHALMDSYSLKAVQYKEEEIWKQANCIPLYKCIEKTKGNKEIATGKNALEKIFCVENANIAEGWIKAIDEFYRCTVTDLGNPEESANKLKSKIKRKTMESEDDLDERREEQILNLEKNGNDQSDSEREEEKKQMDQTMKEIMEQYRQHKETERLRRDKLRIERERMRIRNQKLGSQARCIETALEVKAMADEMTLEKLLKDTKLLHENNLLKDTEQKMQKLWEEGEDDMSQQEADLKKAQSIVYNKMKKDLIQEAADWTKDLDPIDCYRDSLTGGNLLEMKRVCANTIDYGAVPDLKKLLMCLDKAHFCGICCGYYIGAAKETDKVRCMKQCEDIVNSDSNAYLIKYGVGRKVAGPPTGGVPTSMEGKVGQN